MKEFFPILIGHLDSFIMIMMMMTMMMMMMMMMMMLIRPGNFD